MANRTTETVDKVDTLEAMLAAPPPEIHSLEAILDKLPEADRREAYRILYGDLPEALVIPSEVAERAQDGQFDVTTYRFFAAQEQRCPPRRVRIGVIQIRIVEPTDAPVEAQHQAIARRAGDFIEAAGRMGVNVLCLQ